METESIAQPLEEQMSRWRVRATDTLLAALIATYLPLLFGVVTSPDLYAPLALKAFYVTVLVGMGLLLAARRVPPGVRAALLVAVGYSLGVVAFVRFGLPGSGRLYLLIMPFIAQVLVHPAAGRAAAGLSLSLHALFGWLASSGQLDGYLAVHDDTGLSLWVIQLGVMLMLLVPTLLLIEQFQGLQSQLVASERLATARSEAMYGELTSVVAERAQLEREVLDLVERERRLLGRDLHDGLCQQLTGARLRLEVLESASGPNDPQQLRAIRELVENALSQAHDLARGLGTSDEDVGALGDRLAELAHAVAAELKHPCTFEELGDGADPSATEGGQLLRIAREAVANALKHAGATRLVLRLRQEPDLVELSVEDDGVGLPAEPRSEGLGLRIMKHRALTIGATLSLEPGVPRGTRVVCRLLRSQPSTPGNTQ